MATEGPTEVDTSFRTALRRLDAAGLLLKVDSEVDAHLEMTSVMYKQPERAMMFKHVSGYGMPVVGNLMGSEQNLLAIYQMSVAELREYITEGMSNPLPPVTVSSGPVQEVYHENPDLTELLPLPQYAPDDGGRYISAGVVITKDPDTGIHNASYHRFMHLDRNRMLIKLDLGRHLRAIYEKVQARGEPLPIAVILGPDMGTQYAAAIMGAQLPMDMDEFHVASGINHKALDLVDCKTVPLQVPADAEVVLEGWMSPDELVDEGPFMEFSRMYSDVEPAPVTTFTCMYHRKNPIWHVILTTESPIFRKHVLEGVVLKAVKAAAPCVTDVALTAGGLYRFHLNIQVEKRSAADEGLQRNAIFAAIAVLKDLDLLIVVDDDIDIHDPFDVEWALCMRFEASKGLILMPGSRTHEYVTVSDHGVRTKVGIDATIPFGFSRRYKKGEIAPADLSRYKSILEPAFPYGWSSIF